MPYSDLVTIIIPMFNCEKFIGKCLDSCLKQTYKNTEILVIDDGSFDNSLQIVKSYAQRFANIVYIEQRKNMGKVAAVNLGLELARGDYVAFVDADDSINEDKIFLQLDFLNANKDILFCGTSFNRVFNEKVIQRNRTIPIGKINADKFRSNISNTFCPSSILLPLNKATRKLKFRDFFSRLPGEDLDFVARLIEIGPGANIEYVGYNYQFNESSITRIYDQSNREIFSHEIIRFLMSQRLQNSGMDSLNSDLKGLEVLLSNIDMRQVNHNFRKLKRLGLNKNRRKLILIVSGSENEKYSLFYRCVALIMFILSFIPYGMLYMLKGSFEKNK